MFCMIFMINFLTIRRPLLSVERVRVWDAAFCLGNFLFFHFRTTNQASKQPRNQPNNQPRKQADTQADTQQTNKRANTHTSKHTNTQPNKLSCQFFSLLAATAASTLHQSGNDKPFFPLAGNLFVLQHVPFDRSEVPKNFSEVLHLASRLTFFRNLVLVQ